MNPLGGAPHSEWAGGQQVPRNPEEERSGGGAGVKFVLSAWPRDSGIQRLGALGTLRQRPRV